MLMQLICCLFSVFHPSIIYTRLSWSGSQGVLEPIPTCIG
uniref:Uncharacterized protein n=1 Tax=Anguilla anguilla TaxID=7936 RepID=A0A0E9XUX8_ANGAN